MITTPATPSTSQIEESPALAGALRRVQASSRVSRSVGIIAWLAAVILVLQLFGATQHRHELGHHLSDCASCMLATQLPSPPADPVIAAIAMQHASLQYILFTIAFTSAGSSIAAPIPRAQGPPSSFL